MLKSQTAKSAHTSTQHKRLNGGGEKILGSAYEEVRAKGPEAGPAFRHRYGGFDQIPSSCVAPGLTRYCKGRLPNGAGVAWRIPGTRFQHRLVHRLLRAPVPMGTVGQARLVWDLRGWSV